LVEDPAKETQDAKDESQAKQDAMFPDGVAIPSNPMQTMNTQPVKQMIDDAPPAYVVQALLDFRAKLLELN